MVAIGEPGSGAGGGGGAPARTYSYGPFGPTTSQPAGTAGAAANPVRYTGRESGLAVPGGLGGTGGTTGGLQYNRARWYDPSISRFLSEDPADMGGSGTNAYAYVGDDPVDAVDPSGQYAQVIIGCLVGAGASTGTSYLTGRKHGKAALIGTAVGDAFLGRAKASQLI